MKNLLVTGGCGFIGSNFIRYLLMETGFTGRIINVDKLTYAGNPDNLDDIKKRFKDRYIFSQTNICDTAKLEQLFQEHSIDSVCHFAAESHVDRSIINPGEFIQTNIVGTYNLLELCRTQTKDFINFHHISTDEVYGSLGEEGFFTELTSYKPNSPYSASKASSDHIVRSYGRTYGLPYTLSNCSNNYGPYQFPEKLIPLIVLNALKGNPLPVYGDGKHIRDWLYVKDHCRAIWSILEKGENESTYNIGGRNEMQNIQVVELIADLFDEIRGKLNGKSRRTLIQFIKDRPGHDRRYAIDCTKIEAALNWRPKESFETGLKKTIQWYLHNEAWIKRVQTGAYKQWIQSHYN